MGQILSFETEHNDAEPSGTNVTQSRGRSTKRPSSSTSSVSSSTGEVSSSSSSGKAAPSKPKRSASTGSFGSVVKKRRVAQVQVLARATATDEPELRSTESRSLNRAVSRSKPVNVPGKPVSKELSASARIPAPADPKPVSDKKPVRPEKVTPSKFPVVRTASTQQSMQSLGKKSAAPVKRRQSSRRAH